MVFYFLFFREILESGAYLINERAVLDKRAPVLLDHLFPHAESVRGFPIGFYVCEDFYAFDTHLLTSRIRDVGY